MAQGEVNWRFAKEVSWRFSTMDQIMMPMAALLEMSAEIVDAQVRKDIARGNKRTGARRRKPGTKTYYTASAPGEPPAVATGSLLKGVGRSNAYKEGEHKWAVDIGDTAKAGGESYPAILEIGVIGEGYYIQARPVWLKALNKKVVQEKTMNMWKDKAFRKKVL